MDGGHAVRLLTQNAVAVTLLHHETVLDQLAK